MKTQQEVKDAITTLKNVMKLPDKNPNLILEIKNIEALRVLKWCLK